MPPYASIALRRRKFTRTPMIPTTTPMSPYITATAPTPAPYNETEATTAFDTASRQATRIGSEGVDLGYERTRDFDPKAALNEYAKGAWASILGDPGGLKDQLRDLKGSAVGAGRLDTGFFDEDQGYVVNRATQSLANALAQQSLNAASLQQRNNADLYGIGAQQQGVGLDTIASRREEMINERRERDERKRKKKRGIAGAIGGVIGGVGGFVLSGGNPYGAYAGYKAGSAVGQGVAS